MHRLTDEPILPEDMNGHWLDNLGTISQIEFLRIQDIYQLVNFPTSIHGNTLDWIMCKSTFNLVNNTNITERDIHSDHITIHFTLSVKKQPAERTYILTRNLRITDSIKFQLIQTGGKQDGWHHWPRRTISHFFSHRVYNLSTWTTETKDNY